MACFRIISERSYFRDCVCAGVLSRVFSIINPSEDPRRGSKGYRRGTPWTPWYNEQQSKERYESDRKNLVARVIMEEKRKEGERRGRVGQWEIAYALHGIVRFAWNRNARANSRLGPRVFSQQNRLGLLMLGLYLISIRTEESWHFVSTIDQILENNSISKFFFSLFPFAAFRPSVESWLRFVVAVNVIGILRIDNVGHQWSIRRLLLFKG